MDTHNALVELPARKRCGRPTKASQIIRKQQIGYDTTITNQDSAAHLQKTMYSSNNCSGDSSSSTVEAHRGSNSAILPTSIASGAECRRSSRKKIIKFDVRDLLNKNRKPHKIQIEARIDSNAPPLSKTVTPTGVNATHPGSSVTTTDLSSKQKTFIEKSAIFRNLSITEQQNKIMAPPMPPVYNSLPKISILAKSSDNPITDMESFKSMDPVKIAQARRLSRTQEIFNASLMKSKQNSSLIVAQIESNSTATNLNDLSNKKVTGVRRKYAKKPSSPKQTVTKHTTPDSGPQKRRGRPPKNKATPENANLLNVANADTQDSIVKTTERGVAGKKILSNTAVKEELPQVANSEEHKQISERASNWKEYKAYLKEAIGDLLEYDKSAESDEEVKVKLENETCFTSFNQSEDIILEISSSSSTSVERFSQNRSTNEIEPSESQQRNFASVCFWQESANTSDTTSAPDFIIAAVEEIVTENRQLSNNMQKVDTDQASVYADDTQEKCSNISYLEEENFKKAEIEQKEMEEIFSISDVCEVHSPISRNSSIGESDASSYRSCKRLNYSLNSNNSSLWSNTYDTVPKSDSKINTSFSSNNEDSAIHSERAGETDISKEYLSVLDDASFSNNEKTEEENTAENDENMLKTTNMTNKEQVRQNNGTIEDELISKKVEIDESMIFETKNEETDIDAILEQQKKITLPKKDDTMLEQKIHENKLISTDNLLNLPTVAMGSKENSSMPMDEKSTFANDMVSPITKKEPITLPLKKQVSKLKLYEKTVAAIQELAHVNEENATTSQQAGFNDSKKIFDNVNVETITLLNILKTVQENKESGSIDAKELNISEHSADSELQHQDDMPEMPVNKNKEPKRRASSTSSLRSAPRRHAKELNISEDSADSELQTQDDMPLNKNKEPKRRDSSTSSLRSAPRRHAKELYISEHSADSGLQNQGDMLDILVNKNKEPKRRDSSTSSLRSAPRRHAKELNISENSADSELQNQDDMPEMPVNKNKEPKIRASSTCSLRSVPRRHAKELNISEHSADSDLQNQGDMLDIPVNKNKEPKRRDSSTSSLRSAPRRHEKELNISEHSADSDLQNQGDMLDIPVNKNKEPKRRDSSTSSLRSAPRCHEKELNISEHSADSDLQNQGDMLDIPVNKNKEPKRRDSSTSSLRSVPRRHEKRSSRGAESEFKTLEETFADIAAESSKAVLGSKNVDISILQNDETNVVDKVETEIIEVFEVIAPSADTMNANLVENEGEHEGEREVVEVANMEKRNENEKVLEVEMLPPISEPIADVQIEKNVLETIPVEDESRVHNISTNKLEENSSIVLNATKSSDTIENPTNQLVTVTEIVTGKLSVFKEGTELKPKESSAIVEENTADTGKSVKPSKRGRKPKNKDTEPKKESKEVKLTVKSKAEKDNMENVSTGVKEIRKHKNYDSHKKASTESSCSTNESKKNVDVSIKKDRRISDKEGSLSKASPKKALSKMKIEEKIENVSCSGEALDSKISLISGIMKDSEKIDKSNKMKNKNKNKKSIVETKDKTNFATLPISAKDKDEVSRSASGKQKKIEKLTKEKFTLDNKKNHKTSEEFTNLSSSKTMAKKEKKKVESSSTSKKCEKNKSPKAESTAGKGLSKQQTDEKMDKKQRKKSIKEAVDAVVSSIGVSEECAVMAATVEQTSDTNCNSSIVEQSATDELVLATFDSHTITDSLDKTIVESETTNEKPPVAVGEVEEEPDPLKDIEKFIEAGVNLLKRDYKMADDSVDEVITPNMLLGGTNTENETAKQEHELNSVAEGTTLISQNASITDDSIVDIALPDDNNTLNETKSLPVNTFFETPADTPVATPTVTPPPKSPTFELTLDETTAVRRSHRIMQITKHPKALVGRGLVRDRERLSLKDDVETKTHYSLDEHLMDLAEVEAKNLDFLKEMEVRLSNFHCIKENEYKCERIISREARKMICDCFLTAEEEERGELGCGEDCLNRLLMIECGAECNVKERCTNKRFQKFLCSPCRVFRTDKKGFGIAAEVEILPGEFIMEYVGEVIDGDEFENRRTMYSMDKNRHYYFMALRSDAIIDATVKGNISRFINHSCDPNAETQKWTVNGELRIGFFSRKSIMPGEEITFDYQYQRYGREAQRCYCESANCRGWIGAEPTSDEGEQVDDDSEADNLVETPLGSDEDESDDTDEGSRNLETGSATAKLSHVEDEKLKVDDTASKEKNKKFVDDDRKDDDGSKNEIKKLLNKSAEIVSKTKKKTQKEKKPKIRRTSSSNEALLKKSRYLEDPDIEGEVKFLSRCGLKNQSDTLRFSRLMVRAKLPQTRLNLLKILRKGELPCRRLFLDYHGLRLIHGWISEDGGNMEIRLALLETLESLPIANKTVLTDTKVYQSVQNWCENVLKGSETSTEGNTLSPTDDSSKEISNSTLQSATNNQEILSELQKLAIKLISSWDSLPEIFRIPKRERIEQMKEHEREADRQFAAASTEDSSMSMLSYRYRRDRFGRDQTSRFGKPYISKDTRNTSVAGATSFSDSRRRCANDGASNESTKHLSKEQRREMFEAKVARDMAEKRYAEGRREFEAKCRFFGLDPKKVHRRDVPFYMDRETGRWYSVEHKPIRTPPSHVNALPFIILKSTNPADYQLPAVVETLPAQWKFAITPHGKLYYYHVRLRRPQWEPPTEEQIRACDNENTDGEAEGELSDTPVEEKDKLVMAMDKEKLKIYMDKKVEERRVKRYKRLVDERPISPRKEEDRIYNQIEVRKYKENKEKIRKRKEEIRRKRAETLKLAASGTTEKSGKEDAKKGDKAVIKVKQEKDSDDETCNALPIQDYLLSSDEEEIIKQECNNSPLLEKIVQGDKIVDELDAIQTNRTLKRPLPPHRDLNVQPGSSGSSSNKHEHKKRKVDKKERSKKSKDSDSKYRRLKEKFRCEIAGIIVQHLKPYRKSSCVAGRIQSDDDFNHLARKLTHFVMIKELKYCEQVGQTLVVTESVKNKSREFIRKYMAKYSDVYEKPRNDPVFKEIPYTLTN